jgi:protein-S-isoprenylcysteine O-methyltransferase Ste14
MSLPSFALFAYALFLALAFGLRSWLQYRRTGRTGFVGIRGSFGSLEWCAGALFAVALIGLGAAPLLQLLGWVDAWQWDLRPLRIAGIAAVCLGLAGTLWSQLAMGDSWRIGVDASERTTLMVAGPFALVRNPIFTAMLVSALGLVLLVPNWLSLSTLAILVLALEVQVRHVEEPYLLRTHGEAYGRYARATGRFLPGIGRL